jgi:RHH-type rel operon transcriptional repressor/antitoxin RelB
MSSSVSVRLNDRTARALDRLSKQTERPKTYFIEKALESYLEEYADYQVALDRLRDKDDPVISSGDLKKRIGRKGWMPPRIEYKASVASDLEELEPSMARRVLNKIERALQNEGRSGKPLSGEFEGLYRLRVRNYRVVYARTTEGYLVLRIGRREDVYSRGRP